MIGGVFSRDDYLPPSLNFDHGVDWPTPAFDTKVDMESAAAAARMPIELFPCILQHLGRRDLLRVALTNSCLNTLAIKELYSCVEFTTDTPALHVIVFLTALLEAEHHASLVQHLTLEWQTPPLIHLEKRGLEVSVRIARLLSSMTGLRCLSLSSLFGSSVIRVLEKCGGLPLRHLHVQPSVSFDASLVSQWTSLESLTLYPTLTASSPQLGHVFDHLHWLRVSTAATLQTLLQLSRMPVLRTIAINPSQVSQLDNRQYLALVREHLPSLRSIQLLDANMVSLLDPTESTPISHITHVAVSCRHFEGRNATEERLAVMANALAAIFPTMRTFDVRCVMFDKTHPHPSPQAALHTFANTVLGHLPRTLRRFAYLAEGAFERKAPNEPFVPIRMTAEEQV